MKFDDIKPLSLYRTNDGVALVMYKKEHDRLIKAEVVRKGKLHRVYLKARDFLRQIPERKKVSEKKRKRVRVH